jgi:hypothetical protein
MLIFKMIAKPAAAVALTVVAITCTVSTAQAQSAKRLTVAMAPTAPSPVQEAKPVHTSSPAMIAPRAKRVAATVAPAATSGNPDCFWCNRKVYISGLTF